MKKENEAKNEESESNYRRNVNELVQEMEDRLRTKKEREDKDALEHVTTSTCNEAENTLEIQVRGIIK